ncbi:MAG: bifunctional serine/threonine-protein kinase/formylglycine-generating enzyme family protein [Planctomycetota bacterium]|nr:bifunctional serine/threonine-protein kinase/formylglycine-generating enzyme family protein [Planctomycetota bacterium]
MSDVQTNNGKVERVWQDGTVVPAIPRLEFDELIARLLERRHAFTRYQVLTEIGRGGMGRVLRVHDVDMHRELAMKVLREDDAALLDPSSSSERLQLHARFLEEAQVASQLDHPGIVPVHDIGLNPEGRIFFTMKLVRGRTLQEVIPLAERGAEGWSATRVLNVILRVCEAMGYAHERGVLHRDLKPMNVMVGSHGEVYVMDWGLARLVDRPDLHVRSGETESEGLRSARRGALDSGDESAFLTEDGRVLGTPAYMSPEQASGDGKLVTAASDVYSVGAILYQTLAGVPPYSTSTEGNKNNRAVWVRVLAGPPPRVTEFRRTIAPELVAICEKAMQRDVAKRYATMNELADDLRAYLEVRVVRAYRSGPLTELRKWISRNRTAAVLLSSLMVVIASAGFFGAWRERVRANDLGLRADAHRASALVDQLDGLWPIHPNSTQKLRAWAQEVRAFLDQSSDRAAELRGLERFGLSAGRASEIRGTDDLRVEESISTAETRAAMMEQLLAEQYIDAKSPAVLKVPPAGEALCPDDVTTLTSLQSEWEETFESGLRVLPRELEWWTAQANACRARRQSTTVVRFTAPDEEEKRATLEALVMNRARLEAQVRVIDARLEQCEGVREQSIAAHAREWNEALASIRNPEQCPLYASMILTPQVGLVPLRRDPRSGLWEFWMMLTGARPRATESGRYGLEHDTGIVLVLLPGGLATAGAQTTDPQQVRFDPDARATERMRSERLDPFFISKYEMTQGQWLHLTGEMPSRNYPGYDIIESPRVTRCNPVENVSWHEALRIIGRIGCVLPTELQWEWAARAGTNERFGRSADFADVQHQVSFADASYARGKNIKPQRPIVNDGSRIHRPVDSFVPNDFGLHCIMGNVLEMCADPYADSKDAIDLRPGDGLDRSSRLERRSTRGGGWTSDELSLRLSARSLVFPDQGKEDVGLRVARVVDP